ncbi:MAG: hypothetical protein IKU53_02935 [Firmicutes bacterium]|nr:hypothetical protein [Bacillota bacterium]
MAFLDKLGQVAGKVTEVASDTLDYGKAKGKIVLEKGKIKDVKEEIGDYVYQVMGIGETPDAEKLKALCAKIDEHLANIAQYENDAKQSGEDLSDAFGGKEEGEA